MSLSHGLKIVRSEAIWIRALLLALVCLALFAGNSAYAQNSGTIVGTVTDPTGAVLGSAHVTALETATGRTRSVTTNDQGYYVISSLPPSEYQVKVEIKGFAQAIRTGVLLQADKTLSVDVTLNMESTAESVTVSDAPPQIDTTTPTISQIVDQERIVELPLNGRNAATLTTLAPGAVNAPANGAIQSSTFGNQAVGGQAAAVTISVNGSRQTSSNYLMDGSDNMDQYTNVNQPFPMPDSIREFSVQTSNYSAQYGGNSGAVVNVVTRSGTNRLHGTAFEFIRNSALNARNWAATSRDTIKRNQFGGTIGGPVFLPKLYDGREKTFFFFGFQGTIFHSASATNRVYLPTTANLNGDFSAMLSASNPANPLGRAITIKNPVTGQPYPGNIVPTSDFDAAALNTLKLLPSAASPNGLTSYIQPNAPQNFHEELIRIDHTLSSHDRITGRYFRDTYINPAIYENGNILTYKDGFPNISQNLLFSESHIFNNSWLNDFRFTRSSVDGSQNPPSNAPNYADLGVNMYQPTGIPKAIESINISGLFSFGSYPFGKFTRVNYIFDDDVKWVHGRHSISFGGSVQNAGLDVMNNYRRFGSFGFSGDATGYAMSDFLLGRVRSFTQSSGQFQNARNTIWSLYFQDDYHPLPRLTLNLGMRYDPFRPWNEINGRLELFSPDAYAAGRRSSVYYNAPPGLLFPGDQGFPRGGTNASYKNFAPRIGFAYDVTGDGKTSVRGGFGLFFDSRGISQITQAIVSNNPFSPSISITTLPGTFSNPYQGLSSHPPFPYPAPADFTFPLPVTVLTFNPLQKFQVPLSYNWNLSVERQLTQQWSLRTSYVGSSGRHIRRDMQLNPGIYIPGDPSIFGNPSASIMSRTKYAPNYSNINMLTQTGASSYHSFQAALQHRFAHNFTVQASYTYSKSLDNIPQNQTLQNGGGGSFSQPIYMSGFSDFEYGASPFDRTHIFNGSYVLTLPSFNAVPRAARFVIGGWGTSGLLSASTGDAYTIFTGTDVAATGAAPRAILQGKPYGGNGCATTTTACANWLNKSSFALPLPAVGTNPGTYAAYPYKYGNIGKGALRGPGFVNWDVSLYKNFGAAERFHAQFRAEFFNVLNHTNLSDPVATINSGGFGNILSAGDPRIGQLGLKLIF
ncbi:carboxypeptidase regulatory-like domain-containing protein [Edaphobacter albus]|uniref:carboxypeptidase regulatory-like domain-containing protein n=1 Tax=Edaphobacter sp. 4G125 TaxID=2763071 RepID=UPI0016457AF3|nr:carboxypeptidase regulatory-like domain-containing protein [Edaphobacter sp. 4G125]QNI37466.1 TonB-dependent receptor [Edaphobacter sp. 4G125]